TPSTGSDLALRRASGAVMTERRAMVTSARSLMVYTSAARLPAEDSPADGVPVARLLLGMRGGLPRQGSPVASFCTFAGRRSPSACFRACAGPGDVYSQFKYILSVGFEDIGSQEVKNIAGPMRTYRIVPGPVSVAAGAGKAPKTRGGPLLPVR
ncbi:MAG: hypothetical protein V3S45_07210, partial [Kiloniellales bacterium]